MTLEHASFGIAGGVATPVLYDSYNFADRDREQKNVRRVRKMRI